MTFTQYILKTLHKIYVRLFVPKFDIVRDVPGLINSADEASDAIYKLLTSDKPCMIARYGSVELQNVCAYRSMTNPKHSVLQYISNQQFQWWWNEKNCQQMKSNAGFFSNSEEQMQRFGALMCESSSEVDILGSWQEDERFLADLLPKHNSRCRLLYLEPYWATNPWSRALEGKRVLVIHPFAELIEQQYHDHRADLFKDTRVLPQFTLITIKAVQSLGGEDNGFKDWFEALEYMKKKMDDIDYDIALIGCGAYGFPLAAHAKRTGHKAVHLAGALQLLFGIRGKRWDDPTYGEIVFHKKNQYQLLFNAYWRYPLSCNRPKNAQQVEQGCYW